MASMHKNVTGMVLVSKDTDPLAEKKNQCKERTTSRLSFLVVGMKPLSPTFP